MSKLKYFLFLSFFSFFLFKPLDSHALNIYFYGDNYSNLGRCSGLNWCVPNNPNTANIIAIRVEDTEYQIIADSKYQANQTFKIWNKANNFSIRDDVVFYAGAIRPNTITYNAKNSSSYDDFGQTYIVNYGVSNEFTSVTASTGYFYEYYFPSAMQISRFEIAQWDIINTGSTTGDIINNSTNTIINNNNENTQNIINSQNEIKDFLDNDTPPESDISSLGNVQGLLPPGPVDSLLNIPFKFLSVIVSSLGDVCTPLSINWVFDKTLTLPCFSDSFYNNVPSGLMIFINLIPSGFILITYFKYLYKKVNRAVSLETTSDDEWGVL